MAAGSSLPGSYNYVRNSVKVVINAYSGKTTFYDADRSDPILQAYEAAFPHMFTPLSKMSAGLQAHLRYPPDIFSIQSAIYGRYHLTSPSQFYSESNAWQLSPTAGAGTQSQALQVQDTLNQQGQVVSQSSARMAPLYQVTALPGSAAQTFTVTDAYVPASQSNSSGSNNLNLSAFMVATSDPGDYGDLTVYETPQGTVGPGQRRSEHSGQSHRVIGHHALRPARLGGASGQHTHGAGWPVHHLFASPVRGVLLQPAPAVDRRHRRAGAKGGGRVHGVGHLEQPAQYHHLHARKLVGGGSGTSPGTGTVPTAVQQDLAAAQADYTQRPGGARGGRPRHVPDRHQCHAEADHQRAAGAGVGDGDDDYDDHTTTAPRQEQEQQVNEAKTSTTTTSSLATAEPSG